jgi:hypothetical protein
MNSHLNHENHSFHEDEGLRVTPGHGGKDFLFCVFLVLRYTMQSAALMKVGTVPVPPHRPFAFWESDKSPVRVYHLGEATAAGVKPALNV